MRDRYSILVLLSNNDPIFTLSYCSHFEVNKLFDFYLLIVDYKVRINNPSIHRPLFTTRLIGRDNAIARHGIHGLYWLFSISIPGNQLISGRNTIFLTQPRDQSPFQGVMYDYIRLEGPSS